MKFILIGLFGLLGVFSRYFLGLFISKLLISSFPWGTFLINLSGSFLIGIVFVLARERMILSGELGLGLLVGFLGGYTTFSSYCLESVKLAEEGEWMKALTYLGGSSILGFILTLIGILLARKISHS